ncbi:hypothetical protein CDAR_249611 [Caerostris darwini]|uniref:Uncharacterized protein n=1 Tax=Caerostris darwini TaxID=1538125 RepID=A0AAV4RLV0_9ARAC|nr:hypothetical protein CDAR_249611 [Caerostris darwini]
MHVIVRLTKVRILAVRHKKKTISLFSPSRPAYSAHPKTSVTKNMINLQTNHPIYTEPLFPSRQPGGQKSKNIIPHHRRRVIILLTIPGEKHFWLPFGKLLSPYYSKGHTSSSTLQQQ